VSRQAAARDAILCQTDAKNLMKKIISEDLNFDDTVKYGLAMEQGAKKVNEATQSEKKMNV